MTPQLQLVPFHDYAIEAVMHEGQPWAAVRSICQGLGLHVDAQHKKLQAKPWATIRLIRTVAADRKEREILCIDLDSLPMWLATLEPGRVKSSARSVLVAYQKEAARVLRDHFLGRQASSAPLAQVASQEAVALAALEKEVLGLRRDLKRLALPTSAGLEKDELQELMRRAAAQALAEERAVPRVSSEEMAQVLGGSHATLRQVAALEMGSRGAGQELRWHADLVLKTLNRRPAALRSEEAEADPRAVRLRDLLLKAEEHAAGPAKAAYSVAAHQVAMVFDLPAGRGAR